MPLDPTDARQLRRLATRSKKAREDAKTASDALRDALVLARREATVRELAALLEVSHQRIHEIVNRKTR